MGDVLATPALPPSVREALGPGGMPVLDVAAPGGRARIHRQGAHVTAWQPTTGAPVLWVSRDAVYRPGVPIRGGVPVCLPWFGPRPDGVGPAHGFARTQDWVLTEAGEADDAANLAFELRTDGTSEPWWPYPLRARLGVSVGSRLGLALEVLNTGSRTFAIEAALHTYLAVGDVREVRVRGLEGCRYVDKTADGARRPASGTELRITGETDRVYEQPGTVTVADPVLGRTLVIESTHSTHAVIWNPWVDRAAALADMADDEWPSMLCVETAVGLGGGVPLEPGEALTVGAGIAVRPLA